MLQPGTVLRERYKIIESVKSGGMGAVYEAEDLRLEGRRCAIKEILLDPGMDETARAQAQEQFHREASILARLDHPNLPKVSDYFSDSDHDFLVMDFVPGRDLKDIMDEARRADRFLEERDVLNWVTQLMDALDYLHTQEPPVVHRDIKPGNIKLTPDGRIKLVDFGLVKVLAPGDDRTITVLQGRGTAAYTPLEQYGGDVGHTDVRSDIYSLGATLYHLLTTSVADGRQAALSAPRSAGRSHRAEPAHFITRGASHHSRAGAASHRPAFQHRRHSRLNCLARTHMPTAGRLLHLSHPNGPSCSRAIAC